MSLPRTGKSKPKPPPLSPGQVAQVIRQALGPSGWVSDTSHFRERAEQRDFTMQDAVLVLERGTVSTTPRWNQRTGTWNYDVHGTDAEGEPLTVRIAVEGPSSIVLVTAF